MVAGSDDSESWRVLLVAGLEPGKASNIRSFALPDPRTGRPQGFLLASGQLLEVNRFKQAYSAWLAGDRLLADGGMFLATPYDPLFALLPVLERGRDQDEACPDGKFKELDELLYDSATPGLSELLCHSRTAAASTGDAAACAGDAGGGGGAAAEGRRGETPAVAAPSHAHAGGEAASGTAGVVAERVGGEGDGRRAAGGGSAAPPERRSHPPRTEPLPSLAQQLACICDVRRVDRQCYYRLNDQRVLAWLLCKFKQIQAALVAQVAGMEAPYASAYMLSYLAEYVSDGWVTRVAKHLGISEKPVPPGATTTLQPMDGNAAQQAGPPRPPPTSLAGPPEKKQKVDPKVNAKQASLAKQAVGTKKLTSFFAKK